MDLLDIEMSDGVDAIVSLPPQPATPLLGPARMAPARPSGTFPPKIVHLRNLKQDSLGHNLNKIGTAVIICHTGRSILDFLKVEVAAPT